MKRFNRKTFCVLMALVLCAGCSQEQKDYRRLALDSLKENKIEDAFSYLEKAIHQSPSDISNYILLGQIYFQLSQYQKAIWAFAAATRIDPNNGEAYYWLAKSQNNFDRVGDAIKSAQKSVVIFKNERNPKVVESAALLKSIITLKSQKEELKKALANQDEVNLSHLWTFFQVSSVMWTEIKEDKYKAWLMAEAIKAFRRQGFVIKGPPAYYANLLDTVSKANNEILYKPIISVLQTMAVLNNDFSR